MTTIPPSTTTTPTPRPVVQRPRMVLPPVPRDTHPKPRRDGYGDGGGYGGDGYNGGGEVPNAMDLYGQEISRVPLLSTEEERALGERIQAGGDGPDAQAALAELTQRNLRLVLPIARRYLHRGLPLEDLVQEGNIGLMRAAEKFDPARGYRFSTMATWWIRQAISRAVDDLGRVIRVPVHAEAARRVVARMRRDFYAEQGRQPTQAEMRAALPAITEGAWRILAHVPVAVVSLDQPMDLHTSQSANNVDDRARLADLIADPATGNGLDELVSEQVDQQTERARLRAWMRTCLTPREVAVLTLRYGLDGGTEGTTQPAEAPRADRPSTGEHTVRTLGVVGALLGGISRERVRQLETHALDKLRKAARKAQQAAGKAERQGTGTGTGGHTCQP